MAIERPTTEGYRFIDPSKLTEIVSKNSLWYLDKSIVPLTQSFYKDDGVVSQDALATKAEVLRFFTQALQKDQVLLGGREEAFNDDDREPIRTIVVHHTATQPTLTEDELNAMHLLRLYVPIYQSGAMNIDGHYQPIASGHMRKGRQTFVGYHHLVRSSGDHDQILKDMYVGFHAGDYRTNCESIGISIVGNLLDTDPTSAALESTAMIIRGYKQANPDLRIIGHKEVVHRGQLVSTSCPGNRFLGEDGWKAKLEVML